MNPWLSFFSSYMHNRCLDKCLWYKQLIKTTWTADICMCECVCTDILVFFATSGSCHSHIWSLCLVSEARKECMNDQGFIHSPRAWMKVVQSCPTLCNPMEYRVHGVLQARILEWLDFPFSRESSQPKDRAQVSWTAGRFFTIWALREAHYGHCSSWSRVGRGWLPRFVSGQAEEGSWKGQWLDVLDHNLGWSSTEAAGRTWETRQLKESDIYCSSPRCQCPHILQLKHDCVGPNSWFFEGDSKTGVDHIF